ncbi:MAG: pyrroloquinoline quinone biosynthesis protein PqqC, partial [Candidatus Dadabacteria bacterium]|nr:pyrroloquinoline quinone biosynthesis protein PqqC [Candidatus Dadabacteria bacterium]NIQ16117.1 pyrroloquinoline quinone biosynthesis protein PqqC [Candidatus Dadabacteria bacterium]
MNLIKRIDEMIEERSLLKHPFYEMWSDGKLTLESLAGYSKEYFQLVKEV